MILYFNKIRLIAFKHKKPMMSSRKGMLWVQSEIYVDSEKIVCCFDKRFGNYIYFEYENIWYRTVIDGEYYDETKGVTPYSINPLNNKIELSTKKFKPPPLTHSSSPE